MNRDEEPVSTNVQLPVEAQPDITDAPPVVAILPRNANRCGLCRQPNHNIRRCPQIAVLDQQHLEMIARFLLEHDIYTRSEALRYHYIWLSSRSVTELRCLAKKHHLMVQLMNKRDMYRALKVIYIDRALAILEHYFIQQSVRYYTELYDTVTYIERIIHQRDAMPMQMQVLQRPLRNELDITYHDIRPVRENGLGLRFAVESKMYNTSPTTSLFHCPICLEHIHNVSDEVELNCKHQICYKCFRLYIEHVKDSLQNWRDPIENGIPKCPLCRSLIHTIRGDRERLESRKL